MIAVALTGDQTSPDSDSAVRSLRPLRAIDVQPATPRLLRLLQEGDEAFEEATGIRVVGGFDELTPNAADALLRLEHGSPPQWSTHLFVDHTQRSLVGVGGYSHAPIAGTVDITYAIAPELRGNGYATAAACHLVSYAAAAGVRWVTAHTPPLLSPAVAVLQRLQFDRTHSLIDPERGAVWRWERAVADRDIAMAAGNSPALPRHRAG